MDGPGVGQSAQQQLTADVFEAAKKEGRHSAQINPASVEQLEDGGSLLNYEAVSAEVRGSGYQQRQSQMREAAIPQQIFSIASKQASNKAKSMLNTSENPRSSVGPRGSGGHHQAATGGPVSTNSSHLQHSRHSPIKPRLSDPNHQLARVQLQDQIAFGSRGHREQPNRNAESMPHQS